MTPLKKYVILYGNYGSGKTELSLNLALRSAEAGERVTLLDMDIVNPYFRSSEKRAMLEDKGISVIAPVFANTTVDVPSLPAAIYTPFDAGASIDHAFFDAGGDPVGAAALGILKEHFDAVADDCEALYVINTARPLQESAEDIIEMMRQIERISRRPASGLVANTNLARDTDERVLGEGLELVREVSRQTGIPIRFASVLREQAEVLADEGMDVLPIKLYMRPEWLDNL